MGAIALQMPVIGQLDSTEDPKIVSNFNALQSVINGNIDPSNLSTGSQQMFLQLAVAGIHKIAFGNANLSWPGGSPVSNGLTVAHGLGALPICCLATGEAVTGDAASVNVVVGRDGTNLYIGARTTTAFNPTGTSLVYWLAIA